MNECEKGDLVARFVNGRSWVKGRLWCFSVSGWRCFCFVVMMDDNSHRSGRSDCDSDGVQSNPAGAQR